MRWVWPWGPSSLLPCSAHSTPDCPMTKLPSMGCTDAQRGFCAGFCGSSTLWCACVWVHVCTHASWPTLKTLGRFRWTKRISDSFQKKAKIKDLIGPWTPSHKAQLSVSIWTRRLQAITDLSPWTVRTSKPQLENQGSPSVAGRKPILISCWKLLLWLAFHCFYYYNHTQCLAWRTLPLCLTVN